METMVEVSSRRRKNSGMFRKLNDSASHVEDAKRRSEISSYQKVNADISKSSQPYDYIQCTPHTNSRTTKSARSWRKLPDIVSRQLVEMLHANATLCFL